MARTGTLILRTNGTNNGNQGILNLVEGTNITIVDSGNGTVTINSTAASGITIGTTTITSGTDTRVLFDDAGVVGEDAGFTYNKTTDTLTIGTTTTAGTGTIVLDGTIAGSSVTDNFFNVTGTFPGTLAATTRGAVFSFTGDNDGQTQEGVFISFTGVGAGSVTNALSVLLTPSATNNVNNTAISGTVAAGYALNGLTSGGTFLNQTAVSSRVGVGAMGTFENNVGGLTQVGLLGGSYSANNGNSSTKNVGVWGIADNAAGAPGQGAGVIGLAQTGATAYNGGFFTLTSGTNNIANFSLPTITGTAALVASNGAIAANIMVLRDNTTDIATWRDGGGLNLTPLTATMSGSSTTSNFLNLTGTFPSTLSATTNGVLIAITGVAQTVAQTALQVNFTGANANGLQSAIRADFNTTAPSNNVGYALYGGMNIGGGDPPTVGVAGVNNINAASKFIIGVAGQATNNNVSSFQIGVYGISGTGSTATKAAAVMGVCGTDATTAAGGWFGFGASAAPSIANMNLNQTFNTKSALIADNAGVAADIFQARDNATTVFSIIDGGNVVMTQKISTYSGVATAGWGVPAIYANGRSTGQTAAVASVATYTVGAADGSFLITSNVLITTSSAENFTVTCAYTDEGNTARTLTLNFQLLGGVMGTAINFANGAVPYEGIPIRIRAKAATAITIATAGTFTGATYNVEGGIMQIS